MNGCGKDTLVAELSKLLFNHTSEHLNFSLAGIKGFGLDAIMEGPPLGNHNDDEGSLLEKAWEGKPHTGFIVLNELGDAPSEELNKLKVALGSGMLTPKGTDARRRPIFYPTFGLGQYGDELFEGKSPEEIETVLRTLDYQKVKELLLKGREGGKLGAIPPALLDRAEKTGGIFFLPPTLPREYEAVIQTWLPEIVAGLRTRNKIDLVIDPGIISFAASFARERKLSPRALRAVVSDFIVQPISEAMDQGLPENETQVVVLYEKGQIVLSSPALTKKWTFSPDVLFRQNWTCGSELANRD